MVDNTGQRDEKLTLNKHSLAHLFLQSYLRHIGTFRILNGIFTMEPGLPQCTNRMNVFSCSLLIG